MARPNLPEPWLTAARQHGIGESVRAIANRTDLSPETVRRLVHGIGVSSNETVEKVAEALRVSTTQVREWSGNAELGSPFHLPAQANRLNADQRAAVLGVVAAFLGEPVATTKGSDGHGREPAPIDPPLAGPIRPQRTSGPRRLRRVDAEPVAARDGEPDNLPDTSTGEHNQDDGGFEPA